VAVLPGKLTDCESKDLAHKRSLPGRGDSAGGSAKMGRNKGNQAILRCAGKVLNTWEVERDRLFANTEIHDIAGPSGGSARAQRHTRPDRPALRQGLHPGGCRRGRLAHPGAAAACFSAISPNHRNRPCVCGPPPLFRVDAPARGKKPASKAYALDDGELTAILDKLRKEGVREGAWSISRFKAWRDECEQLWKPRSTRHARLLPVQLAPGLARPKA